MSTTTYAADAPITPVKAVPIVATKEVQPDHDDVALNTQKTLNAIAGLTADLKAGAIDQKATADFEVELMKKKDPRPTPTPHPPHPHHPQLPPQTDHGIDIVNSIRTHILCQNWLMSDVEELIKEVTKLRSDNKLYQVQIGKLSKKLSVTSLELRIAIQQRDKAITEYEREYNDHNETKRKLKAITKLYDDLELSHRELNKKYKHLHISYTNAVRKIAQLEADITFMTERITDLEEKLKISNASENVANKRVTELQHYIWELERQKSALEIIKDNWEADVRYYKKEIHYMKRKIMKRGLVLKFTSVDGEVTKQEVEEEEEQQEDMDVDVEVDLEKLSLEGEESEVEELGLPDNEGTLVEHPEK